MSPLWQCQEHPRVTPAAASLLIIWSGGGCRCCPRCVQPQEALESQTSGMSFISQSYHQKLAKGEHRAFPVSAWKMSQSPSPSPSVTRCCRKFFVSRQHSVLRCSRTEVPGFPRAFGVCLCEQELLAAVHRLKLCWGT